MSMTIPKDYDIRVPALRLLKENESLRIHQFEAPLAEKFALTKDEIEQKYDSGNAKIFYDRITWALSYMYMAELVQKPKRGTYQISDLGRKQLETPDNINTFIATQIENREPARKNKSDLVEVIQSNRTPHDELYDSFSKIESSIHNEILDVILNKSPRDFENIVLKLLQRMGYGGGIEAAGEVTNYTNDKGIDGIIKEDVLGLGRIHIQAKRYAKGSSVGREEIQKFVGALAVAQSNKGVFITTSSYSKGASEYAEDLNGATTIVLIDGNKLAQYIYEYGLGMQVEQTFEIKKLDSDFWDLMDDEKPIKP